VSTLSGHRRIRSPLLAKAIVEFIGKICQLANLRHLDKDLFQLEHELLPCAIFHLLCFAISIEAAVGSSLFGCLTILNQLPAVTKGVLYLIVDTLNQLCELHTKNRPSGQVVVLDVPTYIENLVKYLLNYSKKHISRADNCSFELLKNTLIQKFTVNPSFLALLELETS